MVVILAMGIGLFAPPFGVGYYAACAISRIQPDEGMRPIIGYMLALLIGTIVIAAVPGSPSDSCDAGMEVPSKLFRTLIHSPDCAKGLPRWRFWWKAGHKYRAATLGEQERPAHQTGLHLLNCCQARCSL